MLARRPKASLAVVLAASLMSASAEASPTGVEDDPVELIRQRRHLEAAQAFERQYQSTGDAALLFAKATALRRGGDCRGAIEALQRFIATEPPQADVDAAREVIGVCSDILGDDPEPVPPPAAARVEVQPVETPPPPRPWTRDVSGGVLLGTGVAVAVGGIVLLGLGVARTQDREESEAGFERREQSVRTLTATGGAMVAAGAALLIGSIVRYAVVARRGGSSSARARLR